MVTAVAGQPVGNFVLLLAAYLILNSTLNLSNKWALGIYGFRFPFLLTSTHMLFSFLALAPVALLEPNEVHLQILKRCWKGVVYIGTFLALNIALNNLSLLDISLSLNQVIRSTIPVVTCFLAVLVEGRVPSQAEAVSLFILVVGCAIAVWQGSITGKPYAIMFCIAATLCNGAMMTFSGKLLSEKLDVLSKFRAYYVEHSLGVAGIILVTSANALAYNMVHSLMIKRTSAVTTTVLGEVKIVGLLLLSALLLGEGREFTVKMTVGCVTAIVGFCMYSHTKILAHRAQEAKLATETLLAEGELDENETLKP